MKLHWSPRSPFVRKVMIIAHELGLADRIDCVRTVVATTRPHVPLMEENPLSKIPTLVLDDGTVYPISGKLLFSEAKVDAFTGQVTLRGQFTNPSRELLPGMYVRVLIEQGIDSDAIAVPQQAIQRDAGGGSEVFVVKEDGRVATQPVRTGAVQDGLWLVSEGLKDGDRVIVEGFQKFVPGDKVKAKAWIDADASVGTIPGAPATQAAR